MATVAPINDVVRAQRREYCRSVIGHFRMEGLEFSPEEQALFDRYVEGEFTEEELSVELRGLNERDFGSLRLSRHERP